MTARIGIKSGMILASAWLATITLTFQFGSALHREDSRSQSNDTPVDSTRHHGGSKSAESRDLNKTRQVGTQNRFITFTQSLAGDELARILPEITDKMDLDQVQSTLQRLFDEVPPGPTRRVARFELIRRWSQLDPEASFDHIATLDDPKMRHDLRLKGIEGWASVDPQAALEFALDTEDELLAPSRNAAWNGFAAIRDLNSAFAFVSTLASEDRPDKEWTVEKAVGAMYRNDDLAVITWVGRLPPGPVRDQAMSGMVAQWAAHDPEATSKWIEKNVELENLTRIRELLNSVAVEAR